MVKRFTIDLLNDLSNAEYEKAVNSVPGLAAVIEKHQPQAKAHAKLLMEFALHGLAEYSKLSVCADTGTRFNHL